MKLDFLRFFGKFAVQIQNLRFEDEPDYKMLKDTLRIC